VLARIKKAWQQDRKPANVMVVLDNSGSMGDERKLDYAKEGLRGFLDEAAPQDRIGLTKFSTDIKRLVPIAPMSVNRQRIERALDSIFPEETTRVRDAIVEGVNDVENKLDERAINAVVVLTDGADTASNRTIEEVADELAKQSRKEGTGQIRVFTIAYGSTPNKVELGRYAQESGGNSFEAGTDEIKSVYRQISSYF
jgi:Ca-activated chloride channel family protein